MPDVRFRLSGIKALVTALALTITAGGEIALNVGGKLTAEIPAPVLAASSENLFKVSEKYERLPG